MRYRYLVDLRRGISVFAIFSYGFAVLGTPQCPPRYNFLLAFLTMRSIWLFHLTSLFIITPKISV